MPSLSPPPPPVPASPLGGLGTAATRVGSFRVNLSPLLALPYVVLYLHPPGRQSIRHRVVIRLACGRSFTRGNGVGFPLKSRNSLFSGTGGPNMVRAEWITGSDDQNESQLSPPFSFSFASGGIPYLIQKCGRFCCLAPPRRTLNLRALQY